MTNRIALGDLTVNRLGFGAMRVLNADIWGPPKDRPAAKRLFKRALELGVDFFDTSDAYGPHTDEEMIAEALHPYPKGLVIATKGGLLRPTPSRWDPDGRPEHLRAAALGSLKRLKLETIDLYQLHAPDPKVPFEDSVGALAALRDEGKVRHVGLSNVSVKQLEQARKIVPVVSVQNRYNLGDRKHEAVLEACTRLGIAFLPWYPLGAGNALSVSRVKKLAKKKGATPAQILIAWLLARSPMVLPIPGTASIPHLEENMGTASLRLAPEDLAALD